MTNEPRGHCCGRDCLTGGFGAACTCSCEGCVELLPKNPPPQLGPDPLFTFSDAVLKNALEALWQFMEKRGAKVIHYATSLELRLDLYYLGNRTEKEPEEVRMLRTTGDWADSAWEIDDHGSLFEIDRGKVFWAQTTNQEKAREECLKLCFSIMAILGTKADYEQSISERPRFVGPEER